MSESTLTDCDLLRMGSPNTVVKIATAANSLRRSEELREAQHR